MTPIDCWQLEERALNAWPGIEHLVCDGWLLRFARGYTRRANSAVSLYGGRGEMAAQVDLCRAHYARRGLPAVFKLLSFADQDALDAHLAAAGFRREAETSVQVLTLDQGTDIAGSIRIWERPDPVWLEAHMRMNGIGRDARGPLEEILHHIVPAAGYVLIYEGQERVACGLGVCEGAQVGLFSLVTDPAWRNRGYGRQLVETICGWGQSQGADRAYLQVMRDNEAAWRLYARLGFAEAYRYWYRVEPA